LRKVLRNIYKQQSASAGVELIEGSETNLETSRDGGEGGGDKELFGGFGFPASLSP